MRTTVVPAQITTVEDRIAGSISLSQLLILITPVFIGSLLFVILPPFYGYATYKIVLLVCLTTLCGTLAIRVRGKVVLFWLIILVRYRLRPRYYIVDKNDMYLREDIEPKHTAPAEEVTTQKTTETPAPLRLSTADIVAVETILADPTAKPHFELNKKGGIRVHLTEVS